MGRGEHGSKFAGKMACLLVQRFVYRLTLFENTIRDANMSKNLFLKNYRKVYRILINNIFEYLFTFF